MSHIATNWGFQQRGLSPSEFRVLLRLCDRHNPDFGCFPSQDRLADECEISRSSLNNQLNNLEKGGFLRREQRKGKGKRQLSTRYIFAFEDGEIGPSPDPDSAPDIGPQDPQKPSPNIGHGEINSESKSEAEPSPKNSESRVQILDSNPVREPVREPVTFSGDARTAPDGAERETASPDDDLENEDFEQLSKQDQRNFDAGFNIAFRDYDKFEYVSKEPALREWRKLSADVRDRITPQRVMAYQALAKKAGLNHLPAMAKVLREELLFSNTINEVLAKGQGAAVVGDTRQALPKFGKAWGIVRLGTMRLGQRLPGDEDSMEPRRTHKQLPFVGALDGQVLQYLPPEKAIDDEILHDCEKVRVGSDEWTAWENYHKSKGWLMVIPGENTEWVWFPAQWPNEWKHFDGLSCTTGAVSASDSAAGANAPLPRSEVEVDSVNSQQENI